MVQTETRWVAYQNEDGKHVMKRSYSRYHAMLKRCYKPNDIMYHRYGGRGITVCDRWLGKGGYQRFMDDMGECPSPDHSIDRINNDLGYSKENCRWADRVTQNRNTGRNRILVIDGRSLCLEEWSEASGVSSHRIAARLARGWPAKESVFTPSDRPQGMKKLKHYTLPAQEGVSKVYRRSGASDSFITINPPDHVPELQGPWLQIGTRERLLIIDDICLPMSLWLAKTGASQNVVKDRLKRGWSDKDALFTPALGIGKKRPGIRLAKKAATPNQRG